MAKLEHLIVRSMIELRHERGWTQTEFARRMRSVGAGWSANRVSQVETLRGTLSLFEVVALTILFEVPITRLLAGDDKVDVPNGNGLVDLGDARNALTAAARPPAARPSAPPEPAEHADIPEIRKIAKNLGISADQLDRIARLRWGHTFTAERDARTGDVSGLSRRSAQTKRGHATRALRLEIAGFLTAQAALPEEPRCPTT